MHLIIPLNQFKEVSSEAFEDYLKWCACYSRTAYAGVVAYWFTHNGKRFAYVILKDGQEKVFVDPDILEPTK